MAKGGGFERENDKELSLWWTDGKSDDVFWRTSGSGARATMRMKKGQSSVADAGDVRSLDPIGDTLIETFLIEQKRGYTSFGRIDQNELAKAVAAIAKGNMPVKKGFNAINKIFSKAKKRAKLDVLSFVDWPNKYHALEDWWQDAEEKREAAGRPFTMLIMKRDLREACVCFSADCFDLLESISGKFDGNVLRIGYNRNKLVIVNFKGFTVWVSKEDIEALNQRVNPVTINVERSNRLWQRKKSKLAL